MQMDRMRNVRGKTQRPEDFDEDDAEESVDPAVQAALSAALWADLHPLNQADLADDGSDADADHGGADTAANGTTSSSPMLPVAKICALCGHDAKYTCPRCAARTCSLTCIRRHKAEKPCSGIADVTEMVPLSKFSDKHLQRDFHFIEDVKRAVDNAHRGFDNTWRFSFRALPPPLHALREAAKKRGVLCQITSEGMSKRDRNTSRYDRRRDSIIWHIDFDVKGTVSTKNFAVECHWGNERFLLKDIFAQSWESNPRLPSYHIRRGYNRASSWVENPAGPVAGHDNKNGENGNDNATVDADGFATPSGPAGPNSANANTPGPVVMSDSEPDNDDADDREAATASAAAPRDLTAFDGETMVKKANVDRFILEHGPLETKAIFLIKADRVGSVDCYFKLNPAATLHDNLRQVFFVNEFPTIIVAPVERAPLYPIITDQQRTAMRESFRARPREPLPQYAARPAFVASPSGGGAAGFGFPGAGALGDGQQQQAMQQGSGDFSGAPSTTGESRTDFTKLTDEQRGRLARVPCRNFRRRGTCDRGAECPFWHCAEHELPACRSMVQLGQCPLGPRCSFSHDEAVVRRTREEPEFRRVQRGGDENPNMANRRGPMQSRGRGGWHPPAPPGSSSVQ
jgi:hypothetical protein